MSENIFEQVLIFIAHNPELTFSWIITFCFCLWMWLRYLYNLKHEEGNKSEYTTLGMLGTFIGICFGLIRFNPEQVKETLPSLLGGLQFAFITSIFGLILSIRHERKSQKWDTNTDNDPTNKLLKKIADNIRVLGADGEGTLLGQFKLLRSDFNDFATKVAKTSSEQATKAIVEALTDVIKNFNAKITEQFGENFKHLNKGVEKLLVWQKEYKDYMEGYKENLTVLSKAIQTNSKAVEKLPNVVEKVHETVKKTDGELVKLTTTTEALKEFSEELEESLPQLIKSVHSLTEDSVEKVAQLTQETTYSLHKIANEITENNEKLSLKAIEGIETLSKSTSDSLEELDTQVRQTIPGVKKTLEEVVGNTDEQLEVVGRHIVSIVQKLVEDFESLSATLQNFKRPGSRD